MRTERVKGVATIFELEELEAMAKVSEALEELERRIGVENTLMSLETGEIVGIAEIARVRGVLDALHKWRCWEVVNERFDGLS